ncbi:MAG TPA: DUF1963 domain-containing protein [Paenibacillus sp.]|nr:DUF1963 domain-containing protein [Paenibacillus sp.]
MSERLPCQSPGCSATILPTTVLKTGGICMPCHQKRLAAEKQAYIKQNRKDVNRYTGLIDPVEILKIMHTPRQYNPLENEIPYHKSAQELYHQLTKAERERLENYAITLIHEGDFDRAETILLSLVCFTNDRIERGLDALFRKGRYYPGILYKNAGPKIRDELIHLVDRDSENREHLLLALAWISDGEVLQLFARWRKNPPPWASEFYLPPENYAHVAGWELDSEGRKRPLFHPESYHFKVCEEIGVRESTKSAVIPLQTDDKVCPWCGGNLTVLLNYNLQDPLVQFMKLSGQRLRIATCIHCNCYGPVFFEVDLNGNYSWSKYNTVPDFLPEAEPDEEVTLRTMRLSERMTGTYESANWLLGAPASKIGGHPTWIQDAVYPTCPCCSESMMFIAQLDMEQAADREGIYYAFLCGDCMIAAINYQQT